MAALTERDRDVIQSVLLATVDGPFYPHWEFQTLFGYERDTVRAVLDAWPEGIGTDHTDGVVQAAIFQLLAYPHGEWDAWSARSDASIDELKAVARRYAADRAASQSRRQPGDNGGR